MPASGNATWATGDIITATKLNNIEAALTASLATAGDTMTGALTMSNAAVTVSDAGAVARARLNPSGRIESLAAAGTTPIVIPNHASDPTDNQVGIAIVGGELKYHNGTALVPAGTPAHVDPVARLLYG